MSSRARPSSPRSSPSLPSAGGACAPDTWFSPLPFWPAAIGASGSAIRMWVRPTGAPSLVQAAEARVVPPGTRASRAPPAPRALPAAAASLALAAPRARLARQPRGVPAAFQTWSMPRPRCSMPGQTQAIWTPPRPESCRGVVVRSPRPTAAQGGSASYVLLLGRRSAPGSLARMACRSRGVPEACSSAEGTGVDAPLGAGDSARNATPCDGAQGAFISRRQRCRWLELNQRHGAYETPALTN
jgi:hypothetical protein